MAMMIARCSKFRFFMTSEALLCLFGVNSGDRRASDLQNRLLGATNQKTRLTNLGNLTDNTARGNDPIACLQLGDSGLKFALFSLLWPDQKEIEHPEHENHREEERESARAALEEE
jgi:hypothetical protein